ncbi:cell division ATP-binding protein FtsE [Inmirania thermothiophila]|uniref:Cell division ATP-binding protein FtsE n=1 Tax=Inmirania thermothiophila TaxID=1750597 RepID=A0A3N1Y660_9GAMM|nr:cell division ATP-binding protein FtsE [Inmirania thermothiophila]ROR34240.1 cell division transport system ATP-binding protein [Inmirania thermothiophila]
MIRFDAVSKRYPGGGEALSEVSFHLARGEMAFLTGHSGAGKSTLLKLVAGIERATRGQIVVDGENITRLPRRRLPHLRRKIGIIFQDHRLLYDRTVFDNVALPLVIDGLGHREIARRVRAALDKVGLLGKERLNPVVLSGGEQQRVGIARAVVARPPLLIADEPTGNLDPELSAEIMALFCRFNEVGVTVLVASHDLGLIRRLGRRILRLDHGRLVDDGRPGAAA